MDEVLLTQIVNFLRAHPEGLYLHDICDRLQKTTTHEKCTVIQALDQGMVRNILELVQDKYRLVRRRRSPLTMKVSRTKDGKVHFVASHILLFDSYFLCCRISPDIREIASLYSPKCRGKS